MVVDSYTQDEIEVRVRGFDSSVSQPYCSQRSAAEPEWQRKFVAVDKYEGLMMFHGAYSGESKVVRRKKSGDLDCVAAE